MFDRLRIGEGWDVHALVPGRPLVLGGVTIPHHLGLQGHSDADALLHALTDALLGAAALGDIGKLFPDTAAEFKGADSMVLLAEAYRNVAVSGAVPLAVTNCLSFGSPEDPEVMWQFKEAVEGLADGCLELSIPVTGGTLPAISACTQGSAFDGAGRTSDLYSVP